MEPGNRSEMTNRYLTKMMRPHNNVSESSLYLTRDKEVRTSNCFVPIWQTHYNLGYIENWTSACKFEPFCLHDRKGLVECILTTRTVHDSVESLRMSHWVDQYLNFWCSIFVILWIQRRLSSQLGPHYNQNSQRVSTFRLIIFISGLELKHVWRFLCHISKNSSSWIHRSSTHESEQQLLCCSCVLRKVWRLRLLVTTLNRSRDGFPSHSPSSRRRRIWHTVASSKVAICFSWC